MPIRRALIPFLFLTGVLAAAETEAPKPPPPTTWKAILAAEPVQEVRFLPEAFAQPLPVLEAAPAGSRVRKGDLLLRLDPLALDEAHRDAEAALRAAEESLKLGEEEAKAQDLSGESGLKAAETEAQLAGTRLSAFEGMQAPARREDAALNVRGVQARSDDQQDELQQLQGMYDASELAHDTKEIVLKRGRRDLELTRARLELARKHEAILTERELPIEQTQLASVLAQKRAGLETARISRKAQAGRKRLELDKARLELDKARERLDRLKRDRERTTVLAGGEGIVVHASPMALRGEGGDLGLSKLQTQEMAQPRSVLMTVLPVQTSHLVGRVSQAVMGRLALCQAVAVTPRAFPSLALKGEVASISDLPVGRSREHELLYEIRVDLKEQDARLRPGMEADIQ